MSLILTTASSFLMPLLMLFSVFLLLRGHNEPGGGFTGGLVAAAAFALYGVASGPGAARRALVIDPRRLIPIGLVLALGSGLLSFGGGFPFMTGLWVSIPLGAQDKLALGTPLLFDAGVYLVVLGVTLTVILTLAETEDQEHPSGLEQAGPGNVADEDGRRDPGSGEG